MGLSFTIAAGPRHRSYFQIQALWESWPHFTVSDSRLPQSGESGPGIYIPKEQGGSVITPGTVFPLRCLLQLVGLQWRSRTLSLTHRRVWAEQQTKERTRTVTPKRQSGWPLLGNSGKHVTAILRQQPLYYCVRICKPTCHIFSNKIISDIVSNNS
jgi:hypothetical protein